MARRRRKKKRSGARRAARRFYTLLVVCSAIIVSAYALWNFTVRPPEIAPPPVPTGAPVLSAGDPNTSEGDGPGQPSGLVRKDRYYTFLVAASDQSSGNSDTIMVCSYDVPNQRVSLVSVPRDTLVDRRYADHSYHKINAAYAYGGVTELKAAVSELLGIPIDYYVTVDINAFKELVDAVGGVDFHVPVHMSYDDPTQDLHIHYEEGLYTDLNGQQLLEIARCRKNTDGIAMGKSSWMYDAYPDADIGRTRTQQQILVAIAKKLVSWNSLSRITDFVDIFNRNVRTDLGMDAILYFASSAMQVDTASGISTATFPGDGTVTYGRTTYCYQYDREEALSIINAMLNPYTTEVTQDMVHILQVK